jgi:putative membrane protein insertion efficiency factor
MVSCMLVRIVVAVLRLYQRTLSPLLGWLLGAPSGRICRFEPSCSRYAVAALEAHGLLRGGLLSIVRLCKCHPFHPGGYDPPPATPPSIPHAPGRVFARANGATRYEKSPAQFAAAGPAGPMSSPLGQSQGRAG